jgi:hypothetical protein
MDDAELAAALKALGMDEASYRALPLLPLVQVAWADGHMQERERELILRLAEERYALEDEGRRLLKNWLLHPPSREYARRGQKVLAALCARERHEDISPEVLSDVIDLAKEVAEAAGGFFGLRRVAAPEAEAIEEIATALSIAHHRAWVAPEDPTLLPVDADSEAGGPPPEITFHVEGAGQSRGTLVLFDELRGEQTAPVTAEGAVVGRARDCTVQISYDGQVSRRHCRVVENNGRFYVEDLGSTCGTWVNGERVVERRLLGGETIHVGSASFFFQLSPAPVGG